MRVVAQALQAVVVEQQLRPHLSLDQNEPGPHDRRTEGTHQGRDAAGSAAAEAAVHFHNVQRAYSVLTDRARRQAYNDLISFAWRVEVGVEDDDDEEEEEGYGAEESAVIEL